MSYKKFTSARILITNYLILVPQAIKCVPDVQCLMLSGNAFSIVLPYFLIFGVLTNTQVMDFHITEHVLSFQSQIMHDVNNFVLLSNVEFPIHIDRVIVESY